MNKDNMKRRKAIFVLAILALVMLPLMSAGSLTYDASKNTVTIAYDSNNRIANKTTASDTILYTYDSDVNDTLASVSNDDVTISYDYDSKKRVIKETKTIDGISFEKNIAYDSMDRSKNFTGVLENVLFSYGDNALLKTITNIVDIAYNEQNQTTNKSFSNALETLYDYYANTFRLFEIKTGSLQELEYEYDAVGNIEEINDSANSNIISLDYDELHRLVYANISSEGKIINYTYNSIGNLLSMIANDENATFVYDDLAHAPNAVSINGELLPPEDVNMFVYKDSSGDVVAWFGDEGNIVLKGSCFSGGSCTNPGENSIIFGNSIDSITAFVNDTGDLCIEKGDCSDQSASCVQTIDAFRVLDSSGDIVSFIDWDGDMCLTGSLYENYL